MAMAQVIPFFSKYYSSYTIGFSARWGLILKVLPLIILAILYYKRLSRRNRTNKMYVQMIAAYIVLGFTAFYTTWGFRLMYYLSPVQMLLIPAIIATEKRPKHKIILLVITFLYYIAYYIHSFIIMGQDGAYPYLTIWSTI